jgi:hypothetical protein
MTMTTTTSIYDGATPESITMIVRNAQGASDMTKHAGRYVAAEALAATWSDPENLTVQLIDREGVTVWEGNGAVLVALRADCDTGYSDDEFSAALGL